jgi:hypothetical protein
MVLSILVDHEKRYESWLHRRYLFSWAWLVATAWLLFELTSNPFLGLGLLCLRFGRNDFRRARRAGRDPHRHRGSAVTYFLLASSLFRIAVAGILLSPVVFSLESIFGIQLGPENAVVGLCLFVLGIVLGLFFSLKGLETAAKHRLRLWIDGRLFRPNDRAPGFGRGNRMIVILLATGISFSACMAFVMYIAFGRGQNLFDPSSLIFWSSAFLIVWPSLLLVCCQRIIARRPEECWEMDPPWEWD